MLRLAAGWVGRQPLEIQVPAQCLQWPHRSQDRQHDRNRQLRAVDANAHRSDRLQCPAMSGGAVAAAGTAPWRARWQARSWVLAQSWRDCAAFQTLRCVGGCRVGPPKCPAKPLFIVRWRAAHRPTMSPCNPMATGNTSSEGARAYEASLFAVFCAVPCGNRAVVGARRMLVTGCTPG